MANDPLIPLPAFHLRLRRLRRVRGLKQAYVAALLGVDQSTVSRWESGALVPEPELIERALRQLSETPPNDCALRRLVRTSAVACHLVTDTDHRLLAVSLPRQREWVRPASDLMGQSLWRFATPEIAAAEAQLDSLQWWNLAAPAPVVVRTSEAWTDGLHILAGDMVWERVWLSSGEPARLCTPLWRVACSRPRADAAWRAGVRLQTGTGDARGAVARRLERRVRPHSLHDR